jgi:hypothetical protein
VVARFATAASTAQDALMSVNPTAVVPGGQTTVSWAGNTSPSTTDRIGHSR